MNEKQQKRTAAFEGPRSTYQDTDGGKCSYRTFDLDNIIPSKK